MICNDLEFCFLGWMVNGNIFCCFCLKLKVCVCCAKALFLILVLILSESWPTAAKGGMLPWDRSIKGAQFLDLRILGSKS